MARTFPLPRSYPLLLAMVVFALLALRTIRSEDLGYHLAYGGQLLDQGSIVDHDARIYTNPSVDLDAAQRPAAGPGCWYDADGRYRFVNANWLSQAMLAAAWRTGGEGGLTALLVALTAALAALLAITLRRYRVPPDLAALTLLALGVLAAPRLTVRPELFGYVVLAAQVCLLAGSWRGRRTGRVIALIALQLLFVNLHGYFVLGLALTGAALVGRFLERRPSRPLAAALLGQIAVCFANPWGARGAWLPFETVLFMRRHGISSGAGEHPWSVMGEMHRPLPLPPNWMSDPIAVLFVIGLTIGAAALLCAVVRRRWTFVFTIGGMLLVSCTSWRNMAIGLLIATPAAFGVLRLMRWPRPRLGTFGPPAIAALGIAVAVSFAAGALHSINARLPELGSGLSSRELPLAAASWLCEHPPAGRVWTTPSCSSTLYGFGGPGLELNLVTNTWAYPPEIMRAVLRAGGTWGPRPFNPLAQHLGISVVVAPAGRFLRQVANEPGWTVVRLDDGFAVLVKTNGPDAILAAALSPDDLPASPQYPLPTALALADLGWTDAALRTLRTAAEAEPDDARIPATVADVHRRASLVNPARAAEHLAAARAALRHAVELDPASPELQRALDQLDAVMPQQHAAVDGP